MVLDKRPDMRYNQFATIDVLDTNSYDITLIPLRVCINYIENYYYLLFHIHK